MGNYYDKKSTGGRTTSKIENQDSVAAIYALEQLHSTDIFGFGTKIVDFCIKCEGEEDIEIFNKEKHIFIQLKSSVIGKSNFADILDHFGLSHFDAATEEKIFKNSYATAFIYDGDQVVGCARAISDGVCQAAIYNVALLEGYQGQQLGRKLIDSLLEQVKGCNVILYTHPKTVSMYEKMGFRRQKTGMAIYNGNADSLKWMEDTGFLLEEGYRFGDNDYERQPYVPPRSVRKQKEQEKTA